jgi:Ca-activated chloride channel family protein
VLTGTALAGGGAYIPAGTAQVDMAEVYDAVIAAAGRRDFELGTVRRATPRFPWFAGVAFALLVAESLLALFASRKIPAGGAA